MDNCTSFLPRRFRNQLQQYNLGFEVKTICLNFWALLKYYTNALIQTFFQDGKHFGCLSVGFPFSIDPEQGIKKFLNFWYEVALSTVLCFSTV
jgi:hypothetical protein